MNPRIQDDSINDIKDVFLILRETRLPVIIVTHAGKTARGDCEQEVVQSKIQKSLGGRYGRKQPKLEPRRPVA